MTNEERDEILLEMKAEGKKRDEILQEMKASMTNMQESITDMQEEQQQIKEEGKRRDKLLEDMQQEIRSISRSVAKIEVEHGGKIQLLLDVVCGHIDKLDEYEVRFKSDEEILDNHDLRLDILEEKAANL